MSRIYTQCQCTIVWLCDNKDAYPVITEEFNRTYTRKALLQLLSDSYFTRLWIVQEVLLSSNIWVFTSGNVWIPWGAIGDCFLTKAEGPEHAILKVLIAPDTLFQGKSQTLGLCILTFSGQRCENAKDIVYGLLGIVQEKDRFPIDYDKSIDRVYMDAVVAAGPHGREECAERLGNLFHILEGWREHILVLLELVQPIYVMGQISVLRDRSPTTPHGSGLITSIGLAFAEQHVVPPRKSSDSHSEKASFSPSELARAVTVELRDSSRTDAFNASDGGVLMHEAPNSSEDSILDTVPPFDPIPSIVDIHHCLHEAGWVNEEHPKFMSDDWQTHEQIASDVFWTYVALRKREPRPEGVAHRGRPLKCSRRWCYGYQGNIYEYARQPPWDLLFEFRPEIELMRYIFQACSRVRSIIYPEPTTTVDETDFTGYRTYVRPLQSPPAARKGDQDADLTPGAAFMLFL